MKPRVVLASVVASAAILSTSTPAYASLVFERDVAIWTAGDDGSQPRRLAAGIEPHLVPGGAAVLYRSAGGGRLYAVASTGGPRRLVHSFHVPRRARSWWPSEPLHLQFSTDGQRVLVSPAEGPTLLIDLATARVRRLRVPTDVGTLSPDGTQVAWIRHRRSCEIAVLDTASDKVRMLRRVSCASLVQWSPRGVALLTEGRAGTRVSLVNPISGDRQPLLSAPRVLRFASAAATSGAMRLTAYEDRHHRLAAWLVLANGTRVTRTIRATGSLGVIGDPVFTSDDRAVVVLEGNGTLHRIDLITGARVPLGFADGAFDTR